MVTVVGAALVAVLLVVAQGGPIAQTPQQALQQQPQPPPQQQPPDPSLSLSLSPTPTPTPTPPGSDEECVWRAQWNSTHAREYDLTGLMAQDWRATEELFGFTFDYVFTVCRPLHSHLPECAEEGGGAAMRGVVGVQLQGSLGSQARTCLPVALHATPPTSASSLPPSTAASTGDWGEIPPGHKRERGVWVRYTHPSRACDTGGVYGLTVEVPCGDRRLRADAPNGGLDPRKDVAVLQGDEGAECEFVVRLPPTTLGCAVLRPLPTPPPPAAATAAHVTPTGENGAPHLHQRPPQQDHGRGQEEEQQAVSPPPLHPLQGQAEGETTPVAVPASEGGQGLGAGDERGDGNDGRNTANTNHGARPAQEGADVGGGSGLWGRLGLVVVVVAACAVGALCAVGAKMQAPHGAKARGGRGRGKGRSRRQVGADRQADFDKQC